MASLEFILPDLGSGSRIPATPWELVEVPMFVLLAVGCCMALVWSVRAKASTIRNAALEAESFHRRINEMALASDARLRGMLHRELERSRAHHTSATTSEWDRLMMELGNGFGRLEQHTTQAEQNVAFEHDRTLVRLNEAMVVLQQVGLAAARASAQGFGNPKGE